MGSSKYQNAVLGLLLMLLSSCSKTQFALLDTGPAIMETASLYDGFFKVETSSSSFDQPQLESNETQVAFQVINADGSHVTDLKATDIALIENGQFISGANLNANTTQITQTVDIVFAVDVTGSMSSTIESAKSRLVNFIHKSRESGHRTRLCLVTFGDYTIKKCDRFYDNNPQDPATLLQVSELISEITKLKALTGIDDPGGSDFHENPMRALIDASKAPWADKAERFVILVTDDGFLYSPGNQGAVGALAPKYTEVLEAIATSQMKVFAATPSRAGYNRKFNGALGVVEASQGEWFQFSDLIAGKITLDTILNRIMNRVQTTYLVQYNIDENLGFNPELPLAQRKIEVVLLNGQRAEIKILTVQSNLPDGRVPYPKKFKLTDKAIIRNSLRVRVNGVELNTGFRINSLNEVEFDIAPKAKTKVEFFYNYQSLKDSVSLNPIILKLAEQDLHQTVVSINKRNVLAGDVAFNKTTEGFVSVEFRDRVFDESDPYNIRSSQGMKVEIKK